MAEDLSGNEAPSLSYEQAWDRLALSVRWDERRVVHTFMGPFGADWDEAEVAHFLKEAASRGAVFESGPLALAMNHGVVAYRAGDGRPVFFATKD